jgi:protein TonB
VDCNEEAIRLVEKMPKWKPARYNGKPVRNSMIIPIRFMLPEE